MKIEPRTFQVPVSRATNWAVLTGLVHRVSVKYIKHFLSFFFYSTTNQSAENHQQMTPNFVYIDAWLFLLTLYFLFNHWKFVLSILLPNYLSLEQILNLMFYLLTPNLIFLHVKFTFVKLRKFQSKSWVLYNCFFCGNWASYDAPTCRRHFACCLKKEDSSILVYQFFKHA